MSLEPLRDGNQARLGSGCVCDSGCDSCDRLAEAFEAVREALVHVQLAYSMARQTQAHDITLDAFFLVPNYEARAALALADKVTRGN